MTDGYEHSIAFLGEEEPTDPFELARDQGDAIDAVLEAFQHWGVEGYYSADEQEAFFNQRTSALELLRSSQTAFETFYAVCACGWRTGMHRSEAEAEQAWEDHAEEVA